MAPHVQAEHSLALLPGTVVAGQFRVVGMLGNPGGFGITYLATDLRLASDVALKEFLPREHAGRAGDRVTVVPLSYPDAEAFRDGLTAFVNEARRLAQVTHPNVVRVRGFFEANGTAYLVMDYAPGRTLASQLVRAGGRIEAEVAVELGMHVLDGLAAVHAKDILHRDVKPENIYLTSESRPLLLDFGAARNAVGQKTQTLTAILTPGYAPPEQYLTEGKQQGPWTDVYAAAAVLYRVITGHVPPDAFSRREGERMAEPARLDPRVPPHVSAGIMRGLTLDRRQRPQSVAEFQDLLEGKKRLPVPHPGAKGDAQPVPARALGRAPHGVDRRGAGGAPGPPAPGRGAQRRPARRLRHAGRRRARCRSGRTAVSRGAAETPGEPPGPSATPRLCASRRSPGSIHAVNPADPVPAGPT
jgi:serine/threonine protein kinase